MSLTLEHRDGVVHVEQLKTGKNKILVQLLSQKIFMSASEWETSYSFDLIQQIMNVKGPAWLCDEIMRDEDPTSVQPHIKCDIFSYESENSFNNKRILDFGCGCGASTVLLARMLSNVEIVGVELEEEALAIARLRAKHYGLDNVSFLLSPDGSSLPVGLKDFDYVVMSAVYEHLLPNERNVLLPKIWSCLKPGGILFLNQTPNRYFPLESHTTGLPLINYTPDKITSFLARSFSKRVQHESWETLLRLGIRGGTVKEILKILNFNSEKPILLQPQRLGIKNRFDLWYRLACSKRLPFIKRLMVVSLRILHQTTRMTLISYLSLAIKKPS